MAEMRNDMLPDTSETNQVVEETIIPKSVEDEKIEPKVEEEPKVEVPKGYVPYDALHAERQKRKDLEAKLKEAEQNKSFDTSEEVYSDEGLMLKKQIDALNGKIAGYEKKESEGRVYSTYPVLLNRQDEFEEYLEENPDLSLDRAAKLFIFDNKLEDKPVPQRKGLEKPTGGSKTTPTSKYSEADIKRLRETEHRKYIKLIRSGKLNPDDIG
jgi:hypothetical protein